METGSEKITKKNFTTAERNAVIAEWKQSGKSKISFSREQGINYYTLVAWTSSGKKKPKSLQKQSGFSEIKIIGTEKEQLFAKVMVGKTVVDFYQPVSAAYLKELL